MKNKLYLAFALLVLFLEPALAQNVLTKEEAIARFLQYNYDVQIAEQQIDLQEAGADKAAVGYYPTIFVNGVANFDYGGAEQVFQDGREITADGNLTQVYSATAGLNYNIYQGGDRRIRLNRLLEEVKIAEIQKKQIIENGIIQLLTTYHQAAFASQQVDIQIKQIEISRRQVDKIKINREYGRSNRAELLSAQTLFDRDSATLIRLQTDLDMAKRDLSTLLGTDAENVSFILDKKIDYNVIPKVEELVRLVLNNNVNLELLQKNMDLLQYDREIIDASRKPVLGINADYNYQFQDFGVGAFFAQQRSNGVGAGLTVNWNIYDGGRAKNQRQVLQVRNQIQNTELQKQKTLLTNLVYNLVDQWRAAQSLIDVENANIISAESNLERMEEVYAFGGSDVLLLRQAQLSLQQAELSLLQAQYNAKNIELQLLQLSGLLLNEEMRY